MALNTPPTLLGVSGRMGDAERTEEHTRGTRAKGRRRQARCQCRRTEPEALKFHVASTSICFSPPGKDKHVYDSNRFPVKPTEKLSNILLSANVVYRLYTLKKAIGPVSAVSEHAGVLEALEERGLFRPAPCHDHRRGGLHGPAARQAPEKELHLVVPNDPPAKV